MKSEERTLSERLRSAGLRGTVPRLAILTTVLDAGRHLDTVEIVDTVRKRLGRLSRQAVYDNLDVLVEAGFVRRIQIAGQPARYEARVGDAE